MPAPIRSAEDAGRYLEGLINHEREPGFRYDRLGLTPVRRLLARVGNPERTLSVVHVAGSKGKGSTALCAESILAAAGERVGTFTSPHLSRWTERFRIAGSEADGRCLARVTERLRPHVDALCAEGSEVAPTFFDVTTAVALLLFSEAKLDRAILEVGLGGRLDSTNIVSPAVTSITSIELEHTDKLGTTLAEIAGEKAGILKPGVACVLGALPPEALVVVSERASDLGVPLFRHGRDFEVDVSVPQNGPGLTVCYREIDGFRVEAELPLLGRHHGMNAALAIGCARRLRARDAGELSVAIRAGLAAVQLPGRVELLGRTPWVVVDGAHTAASATALSDALRRLPARKRHFVLSVSIGKDLASILTPILEGASSVTVTRAEARRSLDPAELAKAVRAAAPKLALRVVPDPARAVRSAREALTRQDLLCVSGSVYLAGIARVVLASPRQT